MPARGAQREAPDIMAALRTSWRPYVLERPNTRAGVGLRSALPGWGRLVPPGASLLRKCSAKSASRPKIRAPVVAEPSAHGAPT